MEVMGGPGSTQSLGSLRLARRIVAFTLIEVLIASTITVMLMSTLIAGSLQLQRNIATHQDYSKGLSNQMLVSDWLALDLRRARAITAMDANTLKVLVSDYYTSDGKTRRDPTISLVTRANSRTLEVYYGALADTMVEISYYKSGDVVYRREGARGALAIADHVNFDFDPDPDGTGATFADTTKVDLAVQFVPLVKRRGLTDSQRETYIFNTVCLRNIGN
jgi:Tfp pilus assembly protein PilV